MPTPFEDVVALDRCVHEPARLAVMTALSRIATADFLFLQSLTGLTRGNLSRHLRKLEEAELIEITKQRRGRKRRTRVRLSRKGRLSIRQYWAALKAVVPSGEIHLEAESPVMRRMWALAARFAPLDSTVLITGESGVGKDLVAGWLHHHSGRAHGPYVAINCAAVPDSLLESELFGHARGAFTGAAHDRAGLFEAAHSGTLFLDEVGDISAATQVKLLRVLQGREFRRLGETKLRHVDVRLIAATNRDLLEDVAHQRFRQDLYYRLRVVGLHVPPLRERREDLHRLSRDLLTRTAAALHRPITGYEPAALDLILRYTWPGNVRELEHSIEHACAAATGTEIRAADLPDDLRHRTRPTTRSLFELERQHILDVLERTGSQRLAAIELNISRATLSRKLRQYRRITTESSGGRDCEQDVKR